MQAARLSIPVAPEVRKELNAYPPCGSFVWAISLSSLRDCVRLLTSTASVVVWLAFTAASTSAQTRIPVTTNTLQLAPPKPLIPPSFWEAHGTIVILGVVATLAILLAV